MPGRHRQILLVALLAAPLSGCEERMIKVEDKPVAIVSERQGAGTPAKPGDIVTIDYKARMSDGRIIQQARDYRFEVGAGTVILAIDEGVLGMKQGGARTVEAPPHKHWGRKGYGTGANAIPPNTWLTFEIKLTNID